ncbi:FAD-dependent oxidoreductase [Nocardia sp. NPDC024068]|uniref:FAD-dependent oxidoreductase n=1 Tax=Nocardia sp. NPDC024068 TaxID=3157197 RepID=UPI0033FAAC05
MTAGQLSPLADADQRLRTLEGQVRHQIEITEHPTRPWARTSGDGVVPVLIVGAGQAGLAAAFGLRRKGIGDVVVVEQTEPGRAGPWATFARMHTLRSPKDARWPTWDVPAASPRAWFEARYGAVAWEHIEYFPTADWFAFLEWYRRVLAIDVRFGTAVTSIVGADDGRALAVTITGARTTEVVRVGRVVLATGLEGAGGRQVPEVIGQLPPGLWSHTHDDIDFAALRGRRVGILGAGTGAFDNAATALDHGAASVTVHMRRTEMPGVNPYRWMEIPPILEHYPAFTDEQKWLFNERLSRIDQPATQAAVWRCFDFPAFALRYGSPWLSTQVDGDQIVATTPDGTCRYDFIIAATGVAVDLRQRPELARLAGDIALWGDRYTPPAGTEFRSLSSYPYLTDNYAFTSKSGEHAAALGRIHLFNRGARLSSGVLSHQVSGLAGGTDRLVSGLTREIVAERAGEFLEEFLSYDTSAGVVVGPRTPLEESDSRVVTVTETAA